MIMPRFVFSASEVLTDSTRKLATAAWGRSPYNVYAATETSGIAAECGEHAGMHLFEDLVITEVVDADNQPVPPGEYGAKVLVTVLFSRTVPLIRYEMSDSLQLGGNHHCPCGRPYALITGIQGREQESLTFPTGDGQVRAVQPIVFHHIMDGVRSGLADPADRRGAGGAACSAARGRHQCWRVISARPWRPKESCRLRCTSIKWRPSAHGFREGAVDHQNVV